MPGAEPEFQESRTRQDRVQAIRCCSDLEGDGHMGNGHPLATAATKSSDSHLEVIGMMHWSTASIPGAPSKRGTGTFWKESRGGHVDAQRAAAALL